MRRRMLASAAIAVITLGRSPASVVTVAAAPAVRSFEAVSAVAQSTTSVEIKSEHLTGTLPNGVAVVLRLKVEAQGSDPSALIGDGRHFASTGAHNYWPATGFTDGTSVTLSGAVTDSNVPFLLGSPVEVTADASTDAVTLSFGPLTGGPFAGQVLVFSGSGRITITSN